MAMLEGRLPFVAAPAASPAVQSAEIDKVMASCCTREPSRRMSMDTVHGMLSSAYHRTLAAAEDVMASASDE